MAAAGVLLLGLALGGVWSISQVAMVPSAVPPSMAVEDAQNRAPLATGSHTQLRLSAAGPQWRDISQTQRQILMPLRDRWHNMGALTKRRWLVLADRYPRMDETERTKLLSRMNSWASLSTQQRNQARLNFATAQQLSAQDLQAKWDAYQALSEAEKKRLAEQARKAKTNKKSKRRIARVPIADAPSDPATVAPARQPAPSPSSTSEVSSPTGVEPIASSHPVLVPRASPTVELYPLTPAPTLPDGMAPLDSAPSQLPAPATEPAGTFSSTPH